MYNKIEKVITYIEEFLILILMISSLIFLCVNIFLRFFFSTGFVFIEEYARYGMVFLTYFAVSQSIKKNGMIKMDLISSGGEKKENVFRVISNIFSIIMGIILIVFGWQYTAWMFASGERTIGMQVPTFLVYAIVPLGGLLMCFRYIVDTYNVLGKIMSGKPSTEMGG